MSSSVERYDVAIAGGGTAGLALGCALADALGPGARIAVVDRVQLHAGADGKASPLREAAGIGVVCWNYSQTGIVTTVRLEQPHQGRAVQHFLPSGPFAILPLTDNRACITWTEDAARAREILALDD